MPRPLFQSCTGSANFVVRRLALLGAMAIAGGGASQFTLVSVANAANAVPSVKQFSTPSLPSSTSPSSPSPPSTTTQPPITSGTRFMCQMTSGEYTVMYSPQSQPGQVYPWAKPMELGGGWIPERRCNEISRRLEMYRPDGLLEMQTGLENGYNTVCVTTQQVPSCRIVLTVPPGQDPLTTRDRVFENLSVADSGQRTDAVSTLTENDSNNVLNQIGEVLNLPSRSRPQSRSNSINLRPFLDPTDGGTGTRLTRDAAQSSPRLDPNRFR
jgi:hypothetical protein